jgi:4-diphosphocytidyl-2-C-methyl-D-erythritol kinase
MPVTVRSFAKINLGLRIGALRPDGFHELRTVYQTIALHDIVRVDVLHGTGIEIRCADPRVPKDESNTCYGVIEQAMRALAVKGKVVIDIEKRLPVQGGLGGASANAVAALLALERAFRKQLPASTKLRIAAGVGSDLPLFLLGGAILGVGHGEEVYPLPDIPGIPCVVATPEIAVSTPRAFADWDLKADERSAGAGGKRDPAKLTPPSHSDRISEFGRTVSAWLSGFSQRVPMGRPLSGVPARGRGRAESPLLDLVRTGIENDFEQVVFPQYPELHEVKCRLLSAGARYASLSGSGSAVYGLFHARSVAVKAAAALAKTGVEAQATLTLSRGDYWKRMFR